MEIITGIFSLVILIVVSFFQWVTNGLNDYFLHPKIENPISIIIPKDAYLSSNHNYEYPKELFVSSIIYCKKTEAYLHKGDTAIVTGVTQTSSIWSGTKYRYTVMVNNASYEIITNTSKDDSDKPVYAPLLRSINESVCETST